MADGLNDKEFENDDSFNKKFKVKISEEDFLNPIEFENGGSRKISSFSKYNKNKIKKDLEKGKSEFMLQKRKNFFKSVWIVFIVSTTIMLTQYFVFGTIDLLAMKRDENVVRIEIPRNSSNSQIAKILKDNGVIKNSSFFNFYATLTKAGNKLIAGTFEIKTNLDYEAIINFLKSNSNRVETDIVNVVIPEGKNVQEIADILEKNGVCDRTEFLKACKTNDFGEGYSFLKSLKNVDSLFYKVEGYLFPDTYKLYKDSKPLYVIKKMISNYKSKINTKDYDVSEKLSIKDYANKIGISDEDLINIASLIQAEALDEKDMYNVSSVINNRLKTLKNSGKSDFGEDGLNYLGLDSTVWYPYKTRDKVPFEQLNDFSGIYDTYKKVGLPIGPICNAGAAAIDAALKPNKTNYYYFCHDKVSGKPYYARTLKEHQENLKKAGLS